jgi:hypothetical protein
MSADDIRIAWNLVTESLCAVHPDDGTFKPVEVRWPDRFADAHADIQKAATAPGDRRLIIGPTLAEIKTAFEQGG